MPINIPEKLPARNILEKENIFVISKRRASRQDIRPLKIALVNLMPTKVETETQIIRMLSNTPLQIEFELVNMASHNSKHAPDRHLVTFYETLEKIRVNRFDGLIITGAPVEQLEFEEVDYWQELKEIMKWADKNVTSTIYLCWAAQAGLYFHYGIKKYKRSKKIFGVFPHKVVNHTVPLLRGFDDGFMVPHSRHTEILEEDITKVKDLDIVCTSEEAGVHIISSKDGSKIFVMGHSEYDPNTLRYEYERDTEKGLSIDVPKNYFPDDNPVKPPIISWRSNGFLFYSNWLNYYVYQTTPYNWVEKKVT
ncbi:MAG: homoserine O-succinyltransferase [bacterium]|nr:homoserine O-succinyltransferase [bacterium]